MSALSYEEVVDDSEEEDTLSLMPQGKTAIAKPPLLLPLQPLDGGNSLTASSIQTADFTTKTPNNLGALPSSISAFTNASTATASVSFRSSVGQPSSASTRPRPRPAYKGAAGKRVDTNTLTIASASSSTGESPETQPFTSIPPESGTKGAASFLPNAAQAILHNGSNKGVTTGNTATIYPGDIADRVKHRSQSRLANVDGRQPAYTLADDVITISSSDGEADLRPARTSASRPKPRAMQQKDSRPAQRRTETVLPQSDSTNPLTIPMHTSHPTLLDSQLPPSDPPPPSTSTAPMSTPIPAEVSFDGDLSPLSSPFPQATRKIKRRNLVDWDEDKDSMESGAEAEGGGKRKVLPRLPPPPFFGESSSSSVPPNEGPIASSSKDHLQREALSRSRGKPKGRPRPSADDEEGVYDAEPSSKATSKPKARGRKKSGEDDEEWTGDSHAEPVRKSRKKNGSRIDEDEDEWTEDKPAKAKSKAASKKKAGVPKQQMSVVINVPRPEKSNKARTTGKEAKGPASKEFIDDSDLELDSMPPPRTIPSRPPNAPHQVPTAEDDDELLLGSADPGVDSGTITFARRGFVASTPDDKIGDRRNVSRAVNSNKGKKRAVITSDDEGETGDADGSNPVSPLKKARFSRAPRKSAPAVLDKPDEISEGEERPPGSTKENVEPSATNRQGPSIPETPRPSTTPKFSNTNRAYSISSKKSMPMSELIRKVNSLPGSPFASPRPTYSPYAKSSKSVLKRIAPLHPNRRTPPPPPPRPPPPKKSKKQLELEEKWEMELEDSVEGWFCLPEEERTALRRAKRDAEMGFED